MAGEDSDFPQSLNFVLRVPDDEDPLDIAAVIDFHTRIGKDACRLAGEMRRYAESRLTWTAKLTPLVEYLRGDHNG